MRAPRHVAAFAIVIAVSCASPSHVGRWGYEDARSWAGVVLNPDGSCVMVGGLKGSAGRGILCRYSVQGEMVTITEVSDGTHWRAPPQNLTMTYRKARDTFTVSWENNLEFNRVPRLYYEP